MKTVTVERPAPSTSQLLISNSHPPINDTSGRSMESVSDTAPITADAVEWAEARRMANAIQTLARKRAEKAMHAKGSLLHSTNSQGQHGGSPLPFEKCARKFVHPSQYWF
jgi:hypothetical protein